MMGTIKDLLLLIKLGCRRLHSEEDYRAFQAHQAVLLMEYLKSWNVWEEGQLVLDLGSGVGGYSQQMVKWGARVVSLDLVVAGAKFATAHSPVVANALHIPMRNETVDFVLCASLIEHVGDPVRLLNEIQRVLKKGGYCYLSFPPFYSIRGGHEFSPFHYLGERWALRLHRVLNRGRPQWVEALYKGASSACSSGDGYSSHGLFKRTIGQVKRMIDRTTMKIIDVSPRYLFVNTALWPIVGEFLTWHVQFLLRKSAT